MKQQMVSFPGKLVKHLATPANSQYFEVVGKAPFQVLADLSALISKQHKNAKVQAILSHLKANQTLHVTKVPQQNQTGFQAGVQQQQAARSFSQAPAHPKQAEALQTDNSGAGSSNTFRHAKSMPPPYQQPSKHVSNH